MILPMGTSEKCFLCIVCLIHKLSQSCSFSLFSFGDNRVNWVAHVGHKLMDSSCYLPRYLGLEPPPTHTHTH